MHEKDKAKRLYIVRVEFEFPAMLTEKEAAMEGYIGHLVKDALSDMGDSPIERIDEAGPNYRPPHGYDLEPDALVYGTRDDLSWSDAVEFDKSAAKAD